MPGWVSENYLFLARVSKWFYSGVEELTTDQPFVEPFDLPLSKWLKEHNVGWLNARGIDSTRSDADVRKRVAEEMVNPNGAPGNIQVPLCTPQSIVNLIQSLAAMIYCLTAAWHYDTLFSVLCTYAINCNA